MKNKKLLNVTLVILLIFLIESVGLLIAINSIDKLNVDNTTELTATIKNIEITNISKNNSFYINTYDYSSSFSVSSVVMKNIDPSTILSLQKGQTIFVRINNYSLDNLETKAIVNMVSLKNESEEIFSLSDYNDYIHELAMLARVALVFAFVVLFALVVILYKKIKKQNTR